MEISAKIITKFLRKIAMDDKQSLTDCLLDFTKDGLQVNTISTTNLVGVSGTLFASAFKSYDSIGKVGFSDFSKVIRVFDRFGGDVTMKKEGNLFNIKGDNKNVSVELMDEKFFDYKPLPSIDYDLSFTIKDTELADIFKDVKMNSDATMIISTMTDKVMFSNTGKYKFETFIKAPAMIEGTRAEFGASLIDATIRLEGDLLMQIKADFPLFVTEKSDVNIINVMCAPFVSKDEK